MIAQRYSCRPSALWDVHDPYLAWCVDEAAAIAGSHAEADRLTDQQQPVYAAGSFPNERISDHPGLITGPLPYTGPRPRMPSSA